MSKIRLQKVAKYAKKNGIAKTAKDLLTMEGNGQVDYSFTGNMQICKNAVRRAVKWAKGREKLVKSRAT